jgi:hypothetical protein
MKRLMILFSAVGLILLLAAGTVAAASPGAAAPVRNGGSVSTTAPDSAPARVQATDTLAGILGLTEAQVMELRQQGLSLAQIAERQKVDPQRLVDALVAQWTERIDARLANGGITADQATTLRANVAVRAKAMVEQTTMAGMQGAAVGAGPNAAPGSGAGAGPNAATRGTGTGAAARGTGVGAGTGAAGRNGEMRGTGPGTGTCPLTGTAPTS